MVKKQKESELGSGDPYNQNDTRNVDDGASGADPWTNYAEVKKSHGQTHAINESENSQSGNVMGGPARNEPNPAGKGGR